jgi:hypothetical protein
MINFESVFENNIKSSAVRGPDFNDLGECDIENYREHKELTI